MPSRTIDGRHGPVGPHLTTLVIHWVEMHTVYPLQYHRAARYVCNMIFRGRQYETNNNFKISVSNSGSNELMKPFNILQHSKRRQQNCHEPTCPVKKVTVMLPYDWTPASKTSCRLCSWLGRWRSIRARLYNPTLYTILFLRS